MSRTTLRTTLCALTLTVLAACSSTTHSVGTTTPDTGSVPDTASSVPDTAAPVSTEAATTTTIPVDPLLLRRDGIGTHRFGDASAAVIADLLAVLGAPASDTTASYPVADGTAYQDVDGQMRYIATSSRTVCWADSLCVVFGGGAGGVLTFTGWVYNSDVSGSLHSESTATLGSTWADFPTMAVDEGGCYSVGSGTIDGIRLVLQSAGVPFMEVDPSGGFVNHTPAAADVTIIAMEAGDVPVDLFGDC